MKTKQTIPYLCIYLLTVIALSLGCSSTPGKPDNFDYGKIENNKYTNAYFGCELSIPEKWVVQTKEQMEKLSQRGKDLLAGDNSNTKAMLKASEVKSANLLGVFKYEVGAPVDFNPNFMVIVENVSELPGIKTGSDYLFQTRKLLDNTQLRYDYIDSVFAKEKINGTDFYRMNASIKTAAAEVNQIYYSAIMRGFSFDIILTYNSEEQKQELLSVVNTLKFN
jgi:hypothetical protein